MFDGLSLCRYNLDVGVKPTCERTEVFLGYFMNRMRKHLCAKAVNVAETSHDGDHTLKSVSMLVT